MRNNLDTILDQIHSLKNGRKEELSFQDALRVIESYSLINQKVEQKDGEYQKWVSIHRLIQNVTRDNDKHEINATHPLLISSKVLDKFFTAARIGTAEELKSAEILVPHAKALVFHATEIGVINEGVATLASELGSFYHLIPSSVIAFGNQIS